ncbi:unnamed protein product [Allacma fusca]|uniref:Uncharacterized protein n=1 Tax=Allacma fusca TaxID=39272 RepID=A0A8J2L3X9_9HEXA|nr:unnamed protein product [Allacma fusca]
MVHVRGSQLPTCTAYFYTGIEVWLLVAAQTEEFNPSLAFSSYTQGLTEFFSAHSNLCASTCSALYTCLIQQFQASSTVKDR